MRVEYCSSESDFIPSSVGAFVDDVPLVTHAIVRPYIIAILLHRKAVRMNEVLMAISPHCSTLDLKCGAWGEYEDSYPDMNKLEIVVLEVLGEMVSARLVYFNEKKDLWVLTSGNNGINITTIVSWVSTLGGQMPSDLY